MYMYYYMYMCMHMYSVQYMQMDTDMCMYSTKESLHPRLPGLQPLMHNMHLKAGERGCGESPGRYAASGHAQLPAHPSSQSSVQRSLHSRPLRPGTCVDTSGQAL